MFTSHVPSFDGDGQQFTAHVVSLLNQKGGYMKRGNVLESGT